MKVWTATYYHDWAIATDVYTSQEACDAAVKEWMLEIFKLDYTKEELEEMKIHDDLSLEDLEVIAGANDLLDDYLYGIFQHEIAV